MQTILKKIKENRRDNLKIGHIEKHWVRKGFFLASVPIIFFVILYLSDHFISKVNEKSTEIVKDNGLTYITKQVIDYKGNSKEDINTWEIRYNILDSISFLYKDNKYAKEVTGVGIDQAVTFSPEIYPITYNYNEQLKESKISGIIYEFDLDTSERYVASLLNYGYTMRRKILTSNYAEVYLLDTVGNTIRIFCLKDKMLMAQLDEDAPMPEIESYFK